MNSSLENCRCHTHITPPCAGIASQYLCSRKIMRYNRFACIDTSCVSTLLIGIRQLSSGTLWDQFHTIFLAQIGIFVFCALRWAQTRHSVFHGRVRFRLSTDWRTLLHLTRMEHSLTECSSNISSSAFCHSYLLLLMLVSAYAFSKLHSSDLSASQKHCRRRKIEKWFVFLTSALLLLCIGATVHSMSLVLA